MESGGYNLDSVMASETRSDILKSDNPEIEKDKYDEGQSKTKCHCCGVKTEKARLHYGGITCYPCRSFFRRATVSKRRRTCKKNGTCEVKLIHRKTCNSCRYDECVRNGMRPHLVLSENQIKDRFKKQTKSKHSNSRAHLKDSMGNSHIGNNNQGQRLKSDDEIHNPHFITTNIPGEYNNSQPCHSRASIGGHESVIMISNRIRSEVEETQAETDETRITDSHMSIAIQTTSSTMPIVNSNDKLLLETLNTINIKELENMYTVEEKGYVKYMGKRFLDQWLKTNIGHEAMSDYIGWSKKERPLLHQTFQVFHMTTRERFLRMAETMDAFNHLHGQDKFALLKYNLNFAGTLALLRKLSFSNGSDFGCEDRILWDESGLSLHTENIENILDEMPFDTLMKQRFVSLLKELQLPIMADQQVFSLMVAIFIFSSRDVNLMDREKIAGIREGYLTMLRRYVKQVQGDMENSINRVMVIISIVPKLSKLFQKMNLIETS